MIQVTDYSCDSELTGLEGRVYCKTITSGGDGAFFHVCLALTDSAPLPSLTCKRGAYKKGVVQSPLSDSDIHST